MTADEWLACDDPEGMLEVVRGKVSDRKLRLFACACCRRVWHLLRDERLRSAVEVAERFADGRARTRDLLSARDAADQAEYDASYEEYCAEARAHFCITAEYAAALAAASAASAAGITVSRRAVAPDKRRYRGGKSGRLTRRDARETASSLCAVAVGCEAWSVVCDSFGFHDPAGVDYPERAPKEWYQKGNQTHQPAKQAEEAASKAEQTVQASLLRDLVGDRFLDVRINPGWLAWNDHTIPKLAAAVYEERAFDRLGILADALEDAGCADQAVLAHCRGPGPHVPGCWLVDRLMGKS